MQSDKRPLLSIIVPTKNREQCAYYVTKQILSFPYDNIQLIVQDNSNTNKLEEMLGDFKKDNRLKYNYSEKNLSIIDNFNKATEICDGEYVCAIGDDDGINPEIIKIALWAKNNNIPAIKPGLSAVYFWPDSGAYASNKLYESGVLNISKVTGEVSLDNTRKELLKLMEEGCLNYLDRNIVKLYHGIVKKDYLEQIKELTGNYFKGLTPDIYIAIALSTLIDKVITIDYPFTIPGVCKNSGSADSATGKHTGRIEDAPHFSGQVNYVWAEEVPKFYSVDTIWADSAMASVKTMKEQELQKCFNGTILAIKCYFSYPEYSMIIREHYWNLSKIKNINKPMATIQLVDGLIKYPVIDYIPRLKRRLKRRKGDIISIPNVENIISAEKALADFLNSKGLSVDNVIKRLDQLLSNASNRSNS